MERSKFITPLKFGESYKSKTNKEAMQELRLAGFRRGAILYSPFLDSFCEIRSDLYDLQSSRFAFTESKINSGISNFIFTEIRVIAGPRSNLKVRRFLLASYSKIRVALVANSLPEILLPGKLNPVLNSKMIKSTLSQFKKLDKESINLDRISTIGI